MFFILDSRYNSPCGSSSPYYLCDYGYDPSQTYFNNMQNAPTATYYKYAGFYCTGTNGVCLCQAPYYYSPSFNTLSCLYCNPSNQRWDTSTKKCCLKL